MYCLQIFIMLFMSYTLIKKPTKILVLQEIGCKHGRPIEVSNKLDVGLRVGHYVF